MEKVNTHFDILLNRILLRSSYGRKRSNGSGKDTCLWPPGNEHTGKIPCRCQRSAPVWLMSVLQIRSTIPYNARKAVAEVRKIQAGKGVTKREDMEKAFPPVFSNLNLVVVAGYGPVEYASYLRS